ncbi:MAG: hypothetical protein ACKVQC_08555 [Elusimicrobiota bacterium]
MNKAKFFRRISLLLLPCYLSTQVFFLHAAESSLWEDRRKALHTTQSPQSNKQFASLPSSLTHFGVEEFRNLTESLPSLKKTFETSVSVSQPNLKKIPPVYTEYLNELSRNFGMVKEVYVPRQKSKTPLIVLLQDVHLNFEAQNNLAQMLIALNQKAQKKLETLVVGVEGAFGPFDFKRYRALNNLDLQKKLADFFLQENRIAAPSYLGLTAPVVSFQMEGIDDKDSYEKNVEAYLSSRRKKESLLIELNKTKAELNNEKIKEFGKDLFAHEAQKTAYAEGKLSFGDYIQYLSALNEKLSRSEDSLDQDLTLEQFLVAYSMEKNLSLSLVEKERSEILKILIPQLSKSEVDELLALSLGHRMGQISFADYYRHIKNMILKNGIALSRYTSFDKYIQYVLLCESLNAEKLFSALDELETKLSQKLSLDDGDRRLIHKSDWVNLTFKLLDFSLTPQEWERYKKLREPSPSPLPQSGRGLGRGNEITSFESFYIQADIRSEKMVENLLMAVPSREKNPGTRNQEPETSSAAISALVVGGFHTPHIMNLLKKKGIPFALVQPVLTKIDESTGSAYLSVFHREKTPLDELFKGEKLFMAPKELALGNSVGNPVTGAALLAAGVVSQFLNSLPVKPDTGLSVSAQNENEFVVRNNNTGQDLVVVRVSNTPDQPGEGEFKISLPGNPNLYLRAVVSGGNLSRWGKTLLSLATKNGNRRLKALIGINRSFTEVFKSIYRGPLGFFNDHPERSVSQAFGILGMWVAMGFAFVDVSLYSPLLALIYNILAHLTYTFLAVLFGLPLLSIPPAPGNGQFSVTNFTIPIASNFLPAFNELRGNVKDGKIAVYEGITEIDKNSGALVPFVDIENDSSGTQFIIIRYKNNVYVLRNKNLSVVKSENLFIQTGNFPELTNRWSQINRSQAPLNMKMNVAAQLLNVFFIREQNLLAPTNPNLKPDLIEALLTFYQDIGLIGSFDGSPYDFSLNLSWVPGYDRRTEKPVFNQVFSKEGILLKANIMFLDSPAPQSPPVAPVVSAKPQTPPTQLTFLRADGSINSIPTVQALVMAQYNILMNIVAPKVSEVRNWANASKQSLENLLGLKKTLLFILKQNEESPWLWRIDKSKLEEYLSFTRGAIGTRASKELTEYIDFSDGLENDFISVEAHRQKIKRILRLIEFHQNIGDGNEKLGLLEERVDWKAELTEVEARLLRFYSKQKFVVDVRGIPYLASDMETPDPRATVRMPTIRKLDEILDAAYQHFYSPYKPKLTTPSTEYAGKVIFQSLAVLGSLVWIVSMFLTQEFYVYHMIGIFAIILFAMPPLGLIAITIAPWWELRQTMRDFKIYLKSQTESLTDQEKILLNKFLLEHNLDSVKAALLGKRLGQFRKASLWIYQNTGSFYLVAFTQVLVHLWLNLKALLSDRIYLTQRNLYLGWFIGFFSFVLSFFGGNKRTEVVRNETVDDDEVPIGREELDHVRGTLRLPPPHHQKIFGKTKITSFETGEAALDYFLKIMDEGLLPNKDTDDEIALIHKEVFHLLFGEDKNYDLQASKNDPRLFGLWFKIIGVIQNDRYAQPVPLHWLNHSIRDQVSSLLVEKVVQISGIFDNAIFRDAFDSFSSDLQGKIALVKSFIVGIETAAILKEKPILDFLETIPLNILFLDENSQWYPSARPLVGFLLSEILLENKNIETYLSRLGTVFNQLNSPEKATLLWFIGKIKSQNELRKRLLWSEYLRRFVLSGKKENLTAEEKSSLEDKINEVKFDLENLSKYDLVFEVGRFDNYGDLMQAIDMAKFASKNKYGRKVIVVLDQSPGGAKHKKEPSHSEKAARVLGLSDSITDPIEIDGVIFVGAKELNKAILGPFFSVLVPGHPMFHSEAFYKNRKGFIQLGESARGPNPRNVTGDGGVYPYADGLYLQPGVLSDEIGLPLMQEEIPGLDRKHEKSEFQEELKLTEAQLNKKWVFIYMSAVQKEDKNKVKELIVKMLDKGWLILLKSDDYDFQEISRLVLNSKDVISVPSSNRSFLTGLMTATELNLVTGTMSYSEGIRISAKFGVPFFYMRPGWLANTVPGLKSFVDQSSLNPEDKINLQNFFDNPSLFLEKEDLIRRALQLLSKRLVQEKDTVNILFPLIEAGLWAVSNWGETDSRFLNGTRRPVLDAEIIRRKELSSSALGGLMAWLRELVLKIFPKMSVSFYNRWVAFWLENTLSISIASAVAYPIYSYTQNLDLALLVGSFLALVVFLALHFIDLLLPKEKQGRGENYVIAFIISILTGLSGTITLAITFNVVYSLIAVAVVFFTSHFIANQYFKEFSVLEDIMNGSSFNVIFGKNTKVDLWRSDVSGQSKTDSFKVIKNDNSVFIQENNSNPIQLTVDMPAGYFFDGFQLKLNRNGSLTIIKMYEENNLRVQVLNARGWSIKRSDYLEEGDPQNELPLHYNDLPNFSDHWNNMLNSFGSYANNDMIISQLNQIIICANQNRAALPTANPFLRFEIERNLRYLHEEVLKLLEKETVITNDVLIEKIGSTTIKRYSLGENSPLKLSLYSLPVEINKGFVYIEIKRGDRYFPLPFNLSDGKDFELVLKNVNDVKINVQDDLVEVIPEGESNQAEAFMFRLPPINKAMSDEQLKLELEKIFKDGIDIEKDNLPPSSSFGKTNKKELANYTIPHSLVASGILFKPQTFISASDQEKEIRYEIDTMNIFLEITVDKNDKLLSLALQKRDSDNSALENIEFQLKATRGNILTDTAGFIPNSRDKINLTKFQNVEVKLFDDVLSIRLFGPVVDSEQDVYSFTGSNKNSALTLTYGGKKSEKASAKLSPKQQLENEAKNMVSFTQALNTNDEGKMVESLMNVQLLGVGEKTQDVSVGRWNELLSDAEFIEILKIEMAKIVPAQVAGKPLVLGLFDETPYSDSQLLAAAIKARLQGQPLRIILSDARYNGNKQFFDQLKKTAQLDIYSGEDLTQIVQSKKVISSMVQSKLKIDLNSVSLALPEGFVVDIEGYSPIRLRDFMPPLTRINTEAILVIYRAIQVAA